MESTPGFIKFLSIAGMASGIAGSLAQLGAPTLALQAQSGQPSQRPGLPGPTQPGRGTDRGPGTGDSTNPGQNRQNDQNNDRNNNQDQQNRNQDQNRDRGAGQNDRGFIDDDGDGIADNSALNQRRDSMFQLSNPQDRARLDTTMRRLSNLENQLQRNSEQLLQQLGQARQLTGDRQIDAMANVMQQMLQQQQQMARYIVELRRSITGDLSDDSMENRDGRDGQVFGSNQQQNTTDGSANPNSNQQNRDRDGNDQNRGRGNDDNRNNNPNRNDNNPANSGGPGGRPGGGGAGDGGRGG